MAISGIDVRREIADKRPKDKDRTALLSGFARSCLALVRRSGGAGFELCFDCQTDFVRDYISSLMFEQFKVTPKDAAGSSLVYVDCDKLLRGLSIVDGNGDFYDGIPPEFSGSASYARGVFLGCGSMSMPQAEAVTTRKSVGYHLEFSFGAEELADAFSALLGRYGIMAHKLDRADKTVVYVKDSESVSDCLALLGADKTVIRLNEAIAALAVKRDVVRRINCEVANMSRTVRAAVGITEAIELIDRRLGLDTIDEKLAAVARARLADVDAPLSELADKLGISKSGLKHRFDRLVELARRIGPEGEDK